MAEEFSSAVTLPAVPVMVDVAREHVGHVLEDAPPPGVPSGITDRAQQIAIILATSAVSHEGRMFTVSASVHGCRIRIEVAYDAIEIGASAGTGDLYALADEWGHDRAIDGASLLWAEITWRQS